MMKIMFFIATVALLAATVAPTVRADDNGYSNTSTTTNTSTSTTTNPRINKSTINVPCIQSAVTKRDDAIVTALDVYTSAVRTALTTRRDALVAAWALTEKTPRNAALKKAWTAYNGSIRTIRKTFRDAKRASWKQYSIDRKACKVSPVSYDSMGQGVDETL